MSNVFSGVFGEHMSPMDRPMNLEKKHVVFPPFLVKILRLDEALQFENRFGSPGRATAVKNKLDMGAVFQSLAAILGLHWWWRTGNW